MLCERQLVDEWDQEHIALTAAGPAARSEEELINC
jgi:hypothetical protein